MNTVKSDASIWRVVCMRLGIQITFNTQSGKISIRCHLRLGRVEVNCCILVSSNWKS